jgi:FkbM family methyltransferase
MRLPILAGPLRGSWWLPLSPGKVARVLLGSYEPEQTALFRKWLRPGDTLLDVGAHVGYYTLLSARLVGEKGEVWSFEPNPGNCAWLRRHVSLNGLRNVHVEEVAVSDAGGTARFAFGSGSGTGRLAADGTVEVRAVTLDEFCAEHGIRPNALKIDVEGGELRVLAGAHRILTTDRPVIFLSTHGAEIHRECLRVLRSLGYALEPVNGDDLHAATEVIGVAGR